MLASTFTHQYVSFLTLSPSLYHCFLGPAHTSLGLGLPGRTVAVAALFVAAFAQSPRHRTVECVCRSEWYGFQRLVLEMVVVEMMMTACDCFGVGRNPNANRKFLLVC
jgi:hypothetical protein